MGMGGGRSGSRWRGTINAITAAAIGAVWLAGALELRHYHGAVHAQGERRIATVTRLLEENARATLHAPGLLLQHIADKAAASGLDSLLMQRLVDGSDYMRAVIGGVVVDPSGRPVAARPATDAGFADRRWFQEHLAGTELLVGRIVRSRLTGTDVFTLTRRLADAEGRFVGAAAFGIDARKFVDFYRSIDVEGLTLHLWEVDGNAILTEPPDAETGALFAAAVAPRLAAGEAAAAAMVGRGDERRLVAFRHLDDLPLVVAASVPLSEVMAPWRGRLAQELFAALLTTLVILLLNRAVVRALRREEANAARLEELVERLDEARRVAEAAERSQSLFLRTVSHDVHQPLKACRLMLEAAEVEDNPERMRALVVKARHSTDIQQEMLDQLVQHSLLERGEIEPALAELPVAAVLAPAVEMFAGAARKKGLDLRWVPSSLEIVSDPVLLRRIVMNLVNNAVRYAGSGRIVIGCRQRDGEALIEVHDQGPGLSPLELSRLFEGQHRSVARGGDLALGLGMGLTVVDGLARLLGHRIEVMSTVGRGTCFRLRVPLSDACCERLLAAV